MKERTRIGCQVWAIAHKYNIPLSTVHEIINSYIGYCKLLLINGERVDLLGLVSIVPDVELSSYTTTLAYKCGVVANVLGLPEHTVYVIVKAYIDDAIESVLEGKVAEIRSLVVIKPIRADDKIVKIHSNISQSFKYLLTDDNSVVTSVRVHTYKSLRDRLRIE